LVVVDACGGKGFFSCLLSFMASEFWQARHNDDRNGNTDGSHEGDKHKDTSTCPWTLQKIILIEKAKIDWHHIHAANSRASNAPNTTNDDSSSSVPVIELWSETNLHNYDEMLSKCLAICQSEDNTVSLALSGIHLCKMLSPSLLSLANGLGPKLCPYLCLSPCCLPRPATSPSEGSSRIIPIHRYETEQERTNRIQHNQRKQLSRRGRHCYVCKSQKHWVRLCPEIQDLDGPERDKIVEAAARTTPCFNCGLVGHFKPECPTLGVRINYQYPPSSDMDVSDVRNHNSPYERYCELLAQHIETGKEGDSGVDPERSISKRLKQQPAVQVIETNLSDNGGHQEGNWNSRRKSIFIVAAR